jgi:hypothetical protein
MHDILLSLAAALTALVGMAWLALAKETHWRQVFGDPPLRKPVVRRLQGLGALALAASLALRLAVEPASMAVLVWVMTSTAAALAVAFTLGWRARWLRPLGRLAVLGSGI